MGPLRGLLFYIKKFSLGCFRLELLNIIMNSKSLACTGDLIYCHAVGSKYGWYLNQLALVVHSGPNPIKTNPGNYEFKLYLFNHNDYQIIQSKDFDIGNVEIISKKNGSIINSDRLRELGHIARLKSFSEIV